MNVAGARGLAGGVQAPTRQINQDKRPQQGQKYLIKGQLQSQIHPT